MAVDGFGGGDCLLQSQGTTLPTLRTRNTLSQNDCLPTKVKSLTRGKANPMGEALQPMGPFGSSINHSNVIRHPTPAWKGANGHSEHGGRQDLRRLDQSLLHHKPQQEKQLGPGQEPL